MNSTLGLEESSLRTFSFTWATEIPVVGSANTINTTILFNGRPTRIFENLTLFPALEVAVYQTVQDESTNLSASQSVWFRISNIPCHSRQPLSRNIQLHLAPIPELQAR